MPRPGPRPYECVRRAWHSDRHQPMRGSLIQEIFRVVNEIHSSQTKKNKEWQEKLPVVVLKAEEIIYSKANSEAEYMDLQTLRERTNDAIDTIIRKEDSTETGDLLQPCIEAALILGCTARRASRSQRNSNPRSYLTPSVQEPTHVPRRVPDNVTHGGSSRLAPLHPINPTSSPRMTPYYSTTTRPITMSSTPWCLEAGSPHTQDDNPTRSHVFPLSSQNLPPSSSNPVFSVDIHPPENLGHIYPLYYAAHHQTTEPHIICQPPPHSTSSSSAVLAVSQHECARRPTEQGFMQNFFNADGLVNASSQSAGINLATADNPSEIECDLSLQLGPLSDPCASTNSRCTHEAEDIRSSSSQEASKSCDPSTRINKEFCFFPAENADGPLDSSSSKWSSKGKGVDLDASSAKHVTPVSNLFESGHLSHPKFSSDVFFGRMKEPDK